MSLLYSPAKVGPLTLKNRLVMSLYFLAATMKYLADSVIAKFLSSANDRLHSAILCDARLEATWTQPKQ